MWTGLRLLFLFLVVRISRSYFCPVKVCLFFGFHFLFLFLFIVFFLWGICCCCCCCCCTCYCLFAFFSRSYRIRIILLNRSIWPIDGTLTGTTTSGQSGPGGNGNERISPPSPNLQNWSLSIRYSLISYFFFLYLSPLYRQFVFLKQIFSGNAFPAKLYFTGRLTEKYSIIKVRPSHIFVAASHQTRLDTRSKARRPIKVGIKGRGRSGRSRDSNPACQCCSSAHLVQCEPDEASSFTNPNVDPGTYASLRLKLDAWSSAVQSAARPPEGCPAEAGGLFGPESALGFEHPSGTNAKR